MNAVSVSAYFDSKHIRLNEPLALESVEMFERLEPNL